MSGPGALDPASGRLPSVDELATLLKKADLPYRAWGAVSLASGGVGRLSSDGKRLAIELASSMPDVLEHADLAAYAVLHSGGYLNSSDAQRLHDALPIPHAERRLRSSVFGSPLYIYLIARGFGRETGFAVDLARIVLEELSAICQRDSPDLVDVALLFAARLELRDGGKAEDDLLRRIRGSVAGAEWSSAQAVALWWLLDSYGQRRWPSGREGKELREAMRRYVASAGVSEQVLGNRLAAVAMQLDLAAKRTTQYRLVTEADIEAAVKGRMRRRRWFEGAAYLFAIAVISICPMVYAARQGWLRMPVLWAGVVGVAVPAGMYSVLLVAGRQRDVRVLGTAFTIGVVYYAVALYAGMNRTEPLLDFLAGGGTLLVILSSVVSSVWAGVGAAGR